MRKTKVITPEWVKDAIFYQIFPDRFAIGRQPNDAQRNGAPPDAADVVPAPDAAPDAAAPGDTGAPTDKPSNLEPWDSPPTTYGFKGGDLYGVAERLEYLRNLGVTAIYLTPIFASAANHRYHTIDYYRVDPILGGEAAFDHLLERAHALGMRVVLDGVFNHTGRGFYQFQHALENGSASPYLNWFYLNTEQLSPGAAGESGGGLTPYPSPTRIRRAGKLGSRETFGYSAWWNLPALPELNTDTPAVRRFLLEVGRYWIERGADGWRLDVPAEIDDDEFWREFRSVVKVANPEAYIVGEIWTDAERWLAGDQFDAVMNYVVTRAAIGFFGRETLDAELARAVGHGVRKLRVGEFAHEIDRAMALYEDEITQAQLNLLGSHDTPRVASLLGNDRSALALAYSFLFTIPGAPCIYYGDEIQMLGGPDPDCRRSFPAERFATGETGRAHAAEAREAATSTPTADGEKTGRAGEPADGEALRVLIAGLARVRHEHRCLRRGGFRRLVADRATGLYAFARTLPKQCAVVLLNTGQEPWPREGTLAHEIERLTKRVSGAAPEARHIERIRVSSAGKIKHRRSVPEHGDAHEPAGRLEGRGALICLFRLW